MRNYAEAEFLTFCVESLEEDGKVGKFHFYEELAILSLVYGSRIFHSEQYSNMFSSL